MATSVTHGARIRNTVIQHAFKGAWQGILNHRPGFMALKKRGHIETGVTGTRLDWPVRVARHTIEAYDDGEALSFERKNQYILPTLPWATLAMKGLITRDEIAIAGGPEAMERVHKRLITDMTEDFETRINYQFLRQDGAAAGNNLHGVPTWNAGTGSSLTKDAVMSDTYATFSTALSGLGVTDAETDAWTPKGVNTTSSAWTGGGGFDTTDCEEIIQHAIDVGTLGSMAKDRPDLGILHRNMLTTLKTAVAASQRGIVNGTPSGTQGLGIPGALEYSGVEFVFDNDMPATEGYLLNFNHIWLDVMKVPEISEGYGSVPEGGGGSSKDDMFEVLVEPDIHTNGILCRVNFRAQLRFHPRYQVVLNDYA